MKFTIQSLILLISAIGFSQETIPDLLKKHNNKSVPYISIQELAMSKSEVIILDAREPKEYDTSHIKNAIYIGYDNFDIATVSKIIENKHAQIVVYCSVGIRSEVIAEKLKKAGHDNVFNLYGGIFNWKNEDFSVFNAEGKETDSIHTFNQEWSKWLKKGVKVYD